MQAYLDRQSNHSQQENVILGVSTLYQLKMAQHCSRLDSALNSSLFGQRFRKQEMLNELVDSYSTQLKKKEVAIKELQQWTDMQAHDFQPGRPPMVLVWLKFSCTNAEYTKPGPGTQFAQFYRFIALGPNFLSKCKPLSKYFFIIPSRQFLTFMTHFFHCH